MPVLLLCLSAKAASEDTVVVGQKLPDVEVAARRISSNVMSSQPSQTLRGDVLRTLGLSEMSDAVKRLAGVGVQDYGGIGGMKTVSVRNLGTHHTAVSYDGIAVSNTQAGQIDLSRFATDNVGTLKLTVGDGGDALQTARHYASAAVLSIQTDSLRFAFGRDYGVRAQLRGGSWGLVAPSLRYWQRLGGRTTAAFDASYMRADGAYPYTLRNGAETLSGKRRNSDIRSYQCEGNLHTALRGGETIDMKAQWYSSRRGLPGSVVFYNDAAAERLGDEDFFAQAVYRSKTASAWRVQAALKYSHTWNRYTDEDVKYAEGIKTEVNRQNEYYATATLCWSPSSAFTMSLAQDVAANTLRSPTENAACPDRWTSLTALAARLSLRRLTVNGSLVGTFCTEKVAHGDRPDDRKRLSPSLSLSFRVLPREAVYVRLMMRHTFRLPTFNDLYYDRIGTYSLLPERAREYNVGITWSGRPLSAFRYVSATLDIYYNKVCDKIVAFPSMYVWKMANFGKVDIKGINATVETELPLGAKALVWASGTYSLQRAIDLTDPTTTYYKHQLPYTPRHTGSASLTVKTPWLNAGYTLVACSERYSMVQTTPEYRINGYCDQTLTLSRDFRFKRCLMAVQASVRNLTNEHYEVIKFYPMAGRSFDVTAAVRF